MTSRAVRYQLLESSLINQTCVFGLDFEADLREQHSCFDNFGSNISAICVVTYLVTNLHVTAAVLVVNPNNNCESEL